MRRQSSGSATIALALVMGAVLAGVGLGAPADAGAQASVTGVHIPNPLDALPDPADLIAKVFEFFFKTFFGIGATVTRRVVEWLLATPVYTDTGTYAEL